MQRFIGLLTISTNVSRLDGTRLAKEPLSGNPFGRATTFLRQDRGLDNNDRIWVDGEVSDLIGNVPVIIITDAGRELPAVVSTGGALKAARSAKKGAAKESGAKKSRADRSSAKGSAKKSSGE